MSGYYSAPADFSLMSQEEMAESFSSQTSSPSIPAYYSPEPAALASSMQDFSSSTVPMQYYSQPVYAPFSQESYTSHQIWPSPPPPMDAPRPVYPQADPTFQYARTPLQYPNGNLGYDTEHLHRASRSPSYAAAGPSTAQSSPDPIQSDYSRSVSPTAADLRQYGHRNPDGTWSCSYPGCTSRAVFTRGCDLRKHYKRHTKSFFCQHDGCPQAHGGGFSSKKDLARHEAKHNPGVLCEWEGCDRVFSRVDNMRDHIKRIHLKAAKQDALSGNN